MAYANNSIDPTIVVSTGNKTELALIRKYKKPVIGAFMGGTVTEPSAKYLEEHGIPNYNDMDRAARAMWALIEYGNYLKRIN